MAKIVMKGLTEYLKKLEELDVSRTAVLKMAVYEGADEVADAVRDAIKALPEIESGEAVGNWRQHIPVDGITREQKEGLLEGLYVARMTDDLDEVYTTIGFDGYNRVKTQKYPNGQPNSMIARAVESGSSARRKTPFVRPAVNRVKARAIQRMADKLDETLNQIMEGK